MRVNLEERKIDFELVDDTDQSAEQPSRDKNIKKRKGSSSSGPSSGHGGKRDARNKPAKKKGAGNGEQANPSKKRRSGIKKTAKKKAPKTR